MWQNDSETWSNDSEMTVLILAERVNAPAERRYDKNKWQIDTAVWELALAERVNDAAAWQNAPADRSNGSNLWQTDCDSEKHLQVRRLGPKLVMGGTGRIGPPAPAHLAAERLSLPVKRTSSPVWMG